MHRANEGPPRVRIEAGRNAGVSRRRVKMGRWMNGFVKAKPRMITAHFSRCHEIRMGSPYQICSLHLSGDWTPDPYLRQAGFAALRMTTHFFASSPRGQSNSTAPGLKTSG